MLHGSRGGHQQPTRAEFDGTRHWATIEPDGLGWNCTVADDAVSIHMDARHWGWHARACSSRFVSAEFAQSNYQPISDAQVRAFCWYWRTEVESVWGAYTVTPQAFPTHAEAEVWGWTGVKDGKSDCFLYADPAADDLRARIAVRLTDRSWG